VRLTLAVAVLAVVVATFVFLGQKNYFRRLWEIDAESLVEYMVDINAGARSAYVAGALGAYEQSPLTGVGLGASGLYIYDNLPDWALTTVPEIARQLSPESRLYPNPKNMYVRLLSETGLLGFVLFLTFQFSVLGDALTFLPKDGLRRFMGVVGLFSWLSIGLYNFTQDSLATPNIWLIPGILVGMTSTLKENP
jgi:O-antigen ligase